MKCRICWTLLLLVILLTGGLVYRLLIRGQTVPAPDGRTAILLTPDERNLVLREMRQFLVSVQGVLAGLEAGDMQAVARAAAQSGRASVRQVPGGLMRKLPLAFKRLGLAVHDQFDQLALDARQLGDPAQARSQLATLLQNCVACHAAYRLALEPGGR